MAILVHGRARVDDFAAFVPRRASRSPFFVHFPRVDRRAAHRAKIPNHVLTKAANGDAFVMFSSLLSSPLFFSFLPLDACKANRAPRRDT